LRHLHWNGAADLCSSDQQADVPLYQLFQLNVFNEKDITDMLNQSTRLAHLSDDTLDCLLAQANSNGCRLCYDRLFGRFRLVDRVFGRFTDLLQVSLNCQPTNQDQFSPVTTCKDCQLLLGTKNGQGVCSFRRESNAKIGRVIDIDRPCP
ncbi:hypothetical protein D917_09363, partial [Trichinella nativa]